MLFLSLLVISLITETEAVTLINADTGAILYEKNAHMPWDPASTTKVATCIYALSTQPNMNQVVTGNQECIGIVSEKERLKRGYAEPAWRLEKAACHMGIKVGEKMTLRDLFNGMMVASADDASNLIAETISGSIPKFMEELNDYLKKIGCHETTLANPHGLFYPTQKSTAHDLAKLTQVALKDPYFCAFVRAKEFMRPKTNMQESTKYLQTNRLLRTGKYHYPYAIGVKTGWFTDCGYNLIAAAEKDGRKLIAVLLGSPNSDTRFKEAIALFEAAYAEKPVKVEVLKAGRQETPLPSPLSEEKAFLVTASPLFFETYLSDKESYQLTFEWIDEQHGKYSVVDDKGKIRNETFATVEEWLKEKKPFPWIWLSILLLLPFLYFLLRKNKLR